LSPKGKFGDDVRYSDLTTLFESSNLVK